MARNDYFPGMKSTKRPKKELLIIFPLYFYRFAHTLFGKTTGFCQKVSLSPNRIRFSLFSHFSTEFTDKILYLSAKIHNILSLFTYNSGNPWLLPKSILLPNCINRHVNSGIKKAKKREAHQSPRWTPLRSKSLDFKPFLYTFAKSYKIPMALFLNSRLCRC